MKTTGNKRKAAAPVFDTAGYQANLASLNGTPLPDLRHITARRLGWGGARAGAGRQPTGRQPVLLRLTPKTVRKLRAAARKQGTTLSELAEQRLAAVWRD